MSPTSFAGQKPNSPKTVLCNLTQLVARGKSGNVFDATHSKRVAQKLRVDQKGADENFGLPI
jgi:hypothetical protein